MKIDMNFILHSINEFLLFWKDLSNMCQLNFCGFVLFDRRLSKINVGWNLLRNWTLNFILLTLVVLDDGQVAFYRLQTLMTVFVVQPVSSINTISMCIVFRCSRRKTTFCQCLSLFFSRLMTRIYCLS